MNERRTAPLRVTVLFLLLGGLWVSFSDLLLSRYVADPAVAVRFSIYKGWGFMFLSAGVLYWLLHRYMSALWESERTLVQRNNDLMATEENLRASHHEFVELVNSIEGIVWECDGSSLRFTFVSQKAERMIGYPVSQWLSEADFWRQRIHADDREAALAELAAAVRDRHGRSIEYRFVTAQAGTVWVRNNITVSTDQAGIVTLRGVMYDITLQKSVQEELNRLNLDLEQRVAERTAQLGKANEDLQRRAGQLQLINNELESFSYSVSHDLRTPLRHIEGFSRALQEDCSGLLDTDGKMYVQRVRLAAQRMGQLIDDMLKLANVTSSTLTRQTVNLSALARSIASELQLSQPERAARFSIAADVTAYGDQRLLRVVLANLLENAWKYTGQREEADIEFGAMDGRSGKIYFVRDNGAGFDMTYAGKLFSVFQRLHGADEFEGNGIGLATVQRVIRRHGGKVWGEGEVGKGATFYFTLGQETDEIGE